MSRSKPELELYRPGSGPLRKSNEFNGNNQDNRKYYQSDQLVNDLQRLEIEDFRGSTHSLNDRRTFSRSDRDRGSYQSRESLSNMQYGNRQDRNQYDQRPRGPNPNRGNNRNYRNNDTDSNSNYRQRRYHNNDNRNNEETWRPESPVRNRYYDRRDATRQNSEPRILPQDLNRVRDTRSVEPINPGRNWKGTNKPPSGRRNSTIDFPKKPHYDLPPRFKKQLENASNSYSEEPWDGSSVTFQGSSQKPMMRPPQWSQTLPSRGRGRGRIPHDTELDRICNPMSPPPKIGSPCFGASNESLNRCASPFKVERMYRGLHTPPPHITTPPGQFRRGSIDSRSNSPQCPPMSPPTAVMSPGKNMNRESFDWSEEVELKAEIEAGLSDAMTRSSSMASLVDRPKHPKEKRNRRKRNRKKADGKYCPTREPLDPSIENQRHYEYPRRQRSRNSSRERQYNYHSRENSGTREFVRGGGGRQRSRRNSHDSTGDRSRRNSEREIETGNWREEMLTRSTDSSKETVQPPGILLLPKTSEIVPAPVPLQQKKLFDHQNPNKPIVVSCSTSRTSYQSHPSETTIDTTPQTTQTESKRPSWYDQNFRHVNQQLRAKIRIIENHDSELERIIADGLLLTEWPVVIEFRKVLQAYLIELLQTELKFCEAGHVEHHFWKILYLNIIDKLKEIMAENPQYETQIKAYLLDIIDEGVKYFEDLLKLLEQAYEFQLEDYLGSKSYPQFKKAGMISLALVSAQNIYIYLGHLARYKEQANDKSNFGACRRYYIHAQELNPKNGQPYYQLAVIAYKVRRKLDAVYNYMRSLMSSSPFPSAKNELMCLFDSIRKRYEQADKKRRDERAERHKLHMKERERSGANSLRRETWIHPRDGRKRYRTTPTQPEIPVDSEEENISKLSSGEVNKRFITSCIHVHGKLITKIGMDTFDNAAVQMLKEFRALIQHEPIALTNTRILQLITLNMFTIESTQLKRPHQELEYRSEVQERALLVSLQMFNLLLERCISLLKDQLSQPESGLPTIREDLQEILPAIKIWCDWMLCHESVWNPPPSCGDYKVGCQGDVWNRLAELMNLLTKLNEWIYVKFENSPTHGHEIVRLAEDAMLCGFQPLAANRQEFVYIDGSVEMQTAQISLRISRILSFGSDFLCSRSPPVLKYDPDFDKYVSVVLKSLKEDTLSAQDLSSDSDIIVESFSEDEDFAKNGDNMDNLLAEPTADATPEQIRDLLQRKEELERREKSEEKKRKRVQAILQQCGGLSVEIEVKPRILVPDTNCFIDYLAELKQIARDQMAAEPVYYLNVPLVVFNELEGLARGGKTPRPSTRTTINPAHIAKVAEASKAALDFLHSKSPAIRCVTTRGSVVPSNTFSLEEDYDQDAGLRNDDRILETSLSLCHNSDMDQQNIPGKPRKLYREVVLLTDDRALRVKAIARDMPVRELPDFMKWAGLG